MIKPVTEEIFAKELGLRIRRARRAMDITQTELAKAIGGKSASFICEVEKGKKAFSAYNVYLVERIIGPVLRGAGDE